MTKLTVLSTFALPFSLWSAACALGGPSTDATGSSHPAPGAGEGEGEAGAEGEGEGDVSGEGEGAASGEGEGEGEGGGGDPARYDHDGTGTFTTFSVDLQNAGHSFTEHVFLPDGDGPFPVVLLRSGTNQHADAYVPYAQRLASFGVAVLTRDDPGVLVRTPVVVDDLRFAIEEWLPTCDFATKLDLTRVGVTGHSRGGKATLMAAEQMPGQIQAYFGIDAVDVNFIDDGVYGLPTVGDVGIPTTFFTAEIAGNCNPSDYSGRAYYAAASSPSVMVLAHGAGHFECEDETHAILQSACTEPGSADPLVVLGLGVKYATAFFARELLHDGAVGAAFEGVGAAGDVAAGTVDVEAK